MGSDITQGNYDHNIKFQLRYAIKVGGKGWNFPYLRTSHGKFHTFSIFYFDGIPFFVRQLTMRLLLSLSLLLSLLSLGRPYNQGLQLTPQELYGDASNKKIENCIRSSQNNIGKDGRFCKNLDANERKLVEDYLCRYNPTFFTKEKNKIVEATRDCNCCGHFYEYFEQGKVCTRFCIAGNNHGLEPLITLPFNWGDLCPERIFLGDGITEVPSLKKNCLDLMEEDDFESTSRTTTTGKVTASRRPTTTRRTTTKKTSQTTSQQTLRTTTKRTTTMRTTTIENTTLRTTTLRTTTLRTTTLRTTTKRTTTTTTKKTIQ